MTTAMFDSRSGSSLSATLRRVFADARGALSLGLESYGRALARAHRDYPVGL